MFFLFITNHNYFRQLKLRKVPQKGNFIFILYIFLCLEQAVGSLSKHRHPPPTAYIPSPSPPSYAGPLRFVYSATLNNQNGLMCVFPLPPPKTALLGYPPSRSGRPSLFTPSSGCVGPTNILPICTGPPGGCSSGVHHHRTIQHAISRPREE